LDIKENIPVAMLYMFYGLLLIISPSTDQALQSWKKIDRHLGKSLINSPDIDQIIILKVLEGNLIFLP